MTLIAIGPSGRPTHRSMLGAVVLLISMISPVFPAGTATARAACRVAPTFVFVRRIADNGPQGTVTLKACGGGVIERL